MSTQTKQRIIETLQDRVRTAFVTFRDAVAHSNSVGVNSVEWPDAVKAEIAAEEAHTRAERDLRQGAPLTYSVVRTGPTCDYYVAMAWNADFAVLLATSAFRSYTEAKEDLQRLATNVHARLEWYDGERTWSAHSPW